MSESMTVHIIARIRSDFKTKFGVPRQSGLVEALSGMGNTEALDRSAYGSNLSNWYNRQNFLANQSAQARNENDNYWNNLWNGIRTVGNVAKSAYDGYMGYTQQQWENEFAREQWEYNKNRTDQSDALSAYQQAFNLYTQGAGDAASDVLTRYGLNADAFANYTGAPITRDDQASVLSTAASLVASGNQEAAANLLKMYGMDASAAGNYGEPTAFHRCGQGGGHQDGQQFGLREKIFGQKRQLRHSKRIHHQPAHEHGQQIFQHEGHESALQPLQGGPDRCGMVGTGDGERHHRDAYGPAGSGTIYPGQLEAAALEHRKSHDAEGNEWADE